jgi:hypothetical protein
MIPNVQVRQIRSCEECIFFNSLEEFCTLHEDTVFPEKIERIEYEDPSMPCQYHFFADEIMEFVEASENKSKNNHEGRMWMAR